VPAVLIAATLPATAHAASDCAGSDRPAAELGARKLRATTLCLLNAERRAHALAPLRHDRRLARAARRHARDMVAHTYFGHDSRNGAAFTARIGRTGWMRGRTGWFVGENLGWGGGTSSAPRAIVATWMASAGHRRNVLEARFAVVGIAAQSGLPVASGGSGATYAADFGS
jgi:uncharacterized protein YkwD